MSGEATLDLLIQIRDEIAGLNRTRVGMSSTRAEAGKLNEELSQMQKIGQRVGGVFEQFTAANLAANAISFLTRTLMESATAVLAYGQQTQTAARNNELSVQSYQVLADIIEETGGEVGALTMALNQQATSLYAARAGIGASAAAYRELGLAVEELATLPRERQLEALAVAIGKADDKQAAWQAAGEILGRRTVPQLRGALIELAKGYDAATASSVASGKIMDDEAVERLAKAKRMWEDAKQWLTVQSGELLSALVNPFGNTVSAQLEKSARSSLDSSAGTQQDNSTAREIARTIEMRKADLAVAMAELNRGLVEADPFKSDTARREVLLRGPQDTGSIEREIVAREKRLELIKKEKLAENETAESRKLRIAQEEAQITKLNQQQLALRYPPSAYSRIAQAYSGINDPEKNPDYLEAGQGAGAGAMRFLVSLGSTGQQTAAIVERSLGDAMSSLSGDIWDALKGTQEWSDAWRNLGDIAGRMLTQMIAQMLMVQAINAVLGIFGYSMAGGPGIVKSATPVPVKAAGGGSFVTRGPTHFTVGDNPGGVELVSVIPLSGIGRTTIAGQTMRMAGGGAALVRGSARDAVVINQTNNFASGVSREEFLGAMPALVDATKSAVFDEMRRRNG